MVHILKTWFKYSADQWQSFEQLLSPTESQLLSLVRADHSEAEIRQHKNLNARHYRSLTDKLCRQLTFFPDRCQSIVDYQLIVIECSTLLYALKLVSTLGITHTPLDLANGLLEKSRAYDLTNHRMAVLKHLCSYHAEVGGKQYKSVMAEYMNVVEILKAEDTALFIYNDLIAMRTDTKIQKMDVCRNATESLLCLEAFIQGGHISNQFYLLYYKVGILKAHLASDLTQALYYAESGYAYFKALPYHHIQGIQEFLNALTGCHLQLGQVVKARQTIQLLFASGIVVGSPEWIATMRILIRLEISQRQYNTAYKLFVSLTHNKLYKSRPELSKVPERIQEQYFNLLILMGHVTNGVSPSRIKINRFLKKDQTLDFNKKEVRIPLVIAQLIYNIYYKEYDAMVSRLDTLKDYCARRLSPKSSYHRSNLFIRMLLSVPASHFNAIAARRNGKSYYNRMTTIRCDITNNDSNMEVIPYEDLWEIVLTHLKQPKSAVKSMVE